MSNARPAVLALCLSAALFSCGPGTLVPSVTEPPRSSGSRADIKPGELGLGVQLAALRGQSLVAVELGKKNQDTDALVAVERARLYAQSAERAAAPARARFLRLSLEIDAAAKSLRRANGSTALTESLVTAGTVTLEIESEILGATSSLAAYKASVVSHLLYGAAVYYEVAVLPDPIDPEGYRDAYGSLREAQNIHEGLATAVEEQTNDHARAADILMAAMFGAMPSSDPPPDPPPPDEVAAAAYMLGVLLADDHGAVSLPPRDRLAYIEPLLDEALGTYESGEAGVADVLLEKVRASLCCPQTSAGDALEAELERLSNAIRSGATDSDVETLVERSSELAADAA